MTNLLTRRDAISLLVIAAAASTLRMRGTAQSPTATQESHALATDPRRPVFHLLPARNWMNDPNGPIFFQGRYHLFFQYNPEAAIWGNMSWNHAVSQDLLHWTLLPVALTPTPGGADAAGCFSGSTLEVSFKGRPRVYAFYTGVVRDPAHETIRNEGLRESQCLAWSDDPLLRSWTKAAEPVIAGPPPSLQVTGFRDPGVWQFDGQYYMTVGSGISSVGGCVLLYRSTDLHHWEYLHPLVMGSWSGSPTPNPVGDGEMWECPDFFPLGDAHVLIYSSQRHVFWISGRLNTQTMTFQPMHGGLLDLDLFYAPKTQLDAQGRRILWGWIPDQLTNQQRLEAGWSGIMSLPRVLTLRDDGSLRMQVLPETASLRADALQPEISDAITAWQLAEANGEVFCVGQQGAALAFTVLLDKNQLMAFRFLPDRCAWITEEKTYPVFKASPPSVHAFIDGSVIEIILNEELGCTRRFNFTGAQAPTLEVRFTGKLESANAWRVKPISPARLTSSPT